MRWIIKTWRGLGPLRITKAHLESHRFTYFCVTVADVFTKHHLNFSWDDFKFKFALKLYLSSFLSNIAMKKFRALWKVHCSVSMQQSFQDQYFSCWNQVKDVTRSHSFLREVPDKLYYQHS